MACLHKQLFVMEGVRLKEELQCEKTAFVQTFHLLFFLPSRERLVYELDTTGELLVDLGSDQTSCHNPFSGGYYPVQLGFEEAKQLLSTNPGKFRTMVQER